MEKLGQGYTGNPKNDADYTMAATVAHAAGLLRALGLANVHVVGHSRGGYVVARLTLDHPELVRSCTIVDSGTLAPGPSKTEYIMASAPKPRLSRESQRWCIEHYSYQPDHITRAWLDAAEEIGQSAKYQETVRKMEDLGLKRSQFFPQLALEKEETLNWIMQGKLAQPTLLVWGREDGLIPLTDAERFKRDIAGSQLVVIDQCGHVPNLEKAAEFNAITVKFLTEK